MSNLNELLEKLSGANQVEAATPTDTADAIYTDPVFIEKLASAVDFIADGFGKELTKEAEMGKVKANLAAGMGMKEAIKAAYPDYTDEQVMSFMKMHGGKLKGMDKTANIAKVKANLADGMGMMDAIKKAYPDYTDEQVKALAAKMGKEGMDSPKDPKAMLAMKMKMMKGDTMKDKEAADESVVSKLRDALKEKIAAQEAVVNEEENSFIDSIISKIDVLNEEAVKVAEEEQEETVEEEAIADSSTEIAEEDEQVSKEASEDSEVAVAPKLTLAEMLKSANLESTDEAVESVSSGNVKTAAEQGSTISSKLKNSLLSKVRTEV